MELQDGDVERAAAQVVDEDLVVEPAVEAVCERRGGGLVDDPLDGEAGEQAGFLHRVALVVVVVGGNRDDRFRDLLPERRFGHAFAVLEHEGADLRQRVHLPCQHHRGLAVRAFDDLVREVVLDVLHDLGVVLAADQPLGPVDGVARIDHHLVLGDVADQQIALVAHRHHAGQDERALVARDHPRDLVAHVRDARVGSAQIDAEQDGLIGRHETHPMLRRTASATQQNP